MGRGGEEQIGHQWVMEEGQGRLASVRNRPCWAVLPLAAIHVLQTHLYRTEVKISGFNGKHVCRLFQTSKTLNESVKMPNEFVLVFTLPACVLSRHCDWLLTRPFT